MKIIYEPHLKKYARELRSNMTDAENILWKEIRNKKIENVQFYRQKPVGNYIVDFYCPAKKLIIEIDGGQHCEDEATRTDQKRDEYLLKLGFRVLRFDNLEVIKNKEGVLLRTLEELNPPHPSF